MPASETPTRKHRERTRGDETRGAHRRSKSKGMNRNFLSEILAEKRQVIARLQHNSFARGFRERALEIRRNATPHRLLRALEADLPRLNIIAEFKRRSPSAGIIRDDLPAADAARRYERGGACAISVLTDEEYFGGSLEDLNAARSN